MFNFATQRERQSPDQNLTLRGHAQAIALGEH